MRKRMWISLILLILALTVSLVSFVLLQQRFSALGEAMQNAIYADVPLQKADTQILYAWNRCTGLSQAFLLHSDLTELRTAVESLRDLEDQPTLYRIVCLRSLRLLDGIRDSLVVSWQNIL